MSMDVDFTKCSTWDELLNEVVYTHFAIISRKVNQVAEAQAKANNNETLSYAEIKFGPQFKMN